MQIIVKRFLRMYCAFMHFVGIVPTVVFLCCTLILLRTGIEKGRILPCFYYPWLGPFTRIGSQFYDSLHNVFILIGPLLLWRLGFRGKNRFVRIFAELWFSLPWAIIGYTEYISDFVCHL